MLPTGRLVAGEPLPDSGQRPFRQAVDPGTYPVYVHCLANEDLVAYAELRISSEAATRWELAVTAAQNPATLAAGEIFGYAVDAGLGCFLDASTVALLNRHDADLQRQNGDDYISYYDNCLDDILYDPNAVSSSYGTLQPDVSQPNNVAIFQSGYGDGYYATYLALDEGARPVRFITEFIDVAPS